MRTHAHARAHIHMHPPTCTHACACVHVRTHTHTRTHTTNRAAGRWSCLSKCRLRSCVGVCARVRMAGCSLKPCMAKVFSEKHKPISWKRKRSRGTMRKRAKWNPKLACSRSYFTETHKSLFFFTTKRYQTPVLYTDNRNSSTFLLRSCTLAQLRADAITRKSTS